MTYTHRLVYDTSRSSGSQYAEDIQVILDLATRAEPDIRREWSTTATNELEQNLQYSIAKRKKGVIQIQGTFYFNGTDKSEGTLQSAINRGEIDALGDPRLKTQSITSVNTTDDLLTVSGDITRRVDPTSTLVINDSTGNDGVYSIDNSSYDSGADQTVIELSDNLTDSTADGHIQTGIHTKIEQQTWLESYIWANDGAPQHLITGGRFDDDSLGTNVVIESVQTPDQAGQNRGRYNINIRYGRPV